MTNIDLLQTTPQLLFDQCKAEIVDYYLNNKKKHSRIFII